MTSGDMYQGLFRAHFLSPTGQCKAFDSGADGYCRSEGSGLFVLKKLKDALAENDRIYGVIRGIEINQCGNAHSITHPHQETQQALFRKLLSNTSIHPSSVGVVEAHGTGTQAGDAAEISSIQAVFGQPQNSRTPLHITSIKSNTGHAEAASGAAGLAKLLMMLRERKIPPQAKLRDINPRLSNMAQYSLAIARNIEPWQETGLGPRRALLNNFGAAGSNAALLLEEHIPSTNSLSCNRSAYPFVLSAKSVDAAKQLCKRYLDKLSARSVQSVASVCYTATARRERHDYHISLSCNSVEDLQAKLKTQDPVKILNNAGLKKSVVFLFSGQGSIYNGMGAELFKTAPVFTKAVQSCDGVLKSLNFPSIIPMIDGSYDRNGGSDNAHIMMSQCACFIVEYALAQLWRSWNLIPDLVLGHSLGEYAALVDAGILSMPDALRIVANRAALMAQLCQPGQTAMLACGRPSDVIRELISSDGQLGGLTIACCNSPKDCVVSGPLEQIETLNKLCKHHNWQHKKLDVPYGFHSSAMDCILAPMQQICSAVQIASPRIPVGSNYHGRLLKLEDLSAQYFLNQTRYPVRFVDMLRSIPENILDSATFIEIGPAGITLPMAKNTLSNKDLTYLPSLSPKQKSWITLSASLTSLVGKGLDVNWRSVFDGSGAEVVDAPSYPFASTDLIVPFTGQGIGADVKSITQDVKSRLPFGISKTSESGTYQTSLGMLSEYISGHVVGGAGICPASVYHSMMLEAGSSALNTSTEDALVVKDLAFDQPLIHEPARDRDKLALNLDPPSLKNPRHCGYHSFKVSSITQTGTGKASIHCRGRIGRESMASLKEGFARNSAMIRRQQSHWKHVSESRLDAFTTKMLYEIIFPRVVTYSRAYQTITKLVALDDGSEGFGTFKVPPPTNDEDVLLPPKFIDTLLHAAGFIANSHVPSTEVCICAKVENIKVLYGDLPRNQELSVYCSLLHCVEGTVLADSYALNKNGDVVASVEGMHFKKLQLRSFKAHLSRQISTSNTTSHVHSPAKRLATKTPARLSKIAGGASLNLTLEEPGRPVVQQQSIDSAVDILAKVCELVPEDIKPQSILAGLGFDSLTLIELSDAINKSFPGLCLDHSSIDTEWTVQQLQSYIQDKLPSSSHSQPRSVPVKLAHQRRLSHSNMRRKSLTLSVPSSPLLRFDNQHPGHMSAIVDSPPDTPVTCVKSIIQDICGISISDLKPDSTFESLGVDSLLCIELSHALKEEYGMEILESSFTKDLTLEGLGDMIMPDWKKQQLSQPLDVEPERSVKKPHTPPAVVQSFSGTSVPLFLFHDGSGTIGMYSNIKSLDRDVLGIANSLLSDNEHWANSLDEMAAAYASVIAKTSYQSVILGGWSFGGVLAHEVARQLSQTDKTVRGVILIDSPCPRDHEPLPEPIIEHILQPSLSKNSEVGKLSASWVANQFRQHARFLGDYTFKLLDSNLQCRYYMLLSQDTIDTSGACGISYPWLEDAGAHMRTAQGWEALVGQEVKVMTIPGNHFEPFTPRCVDVVSSLLKEACDEIANHQE